MAKKSDTKKVVGVVERPPAKMGRPTEYRPELCDLLVRHMSEGNTIESFGSVAKCCTATVYNWFKEHPDFLEAKKQGEPLLHKFYESMGKMIASGQMRRIKSETPVLDSNGKPVYDNDGKVLKTIEYEPATPGQSVFIFMTKNMLGWKDRNDLTLRNPEGPDGKSKPFELNVGSLSNAEIEARYQELLQKALSEGEA